MRASVCKQFGAMAFALKSGLCSKLVGFLCSLLPCESLHSHLQWVTCSDESKSKSKEFHTQFKAL